MAPIDSRAAPGAVCEALPGGLATLDELDMRLLRLTQDSFPLAERPYEQLARGLRLSEEETLARVRRLLDEGVIRRIAPIFDARALDYSTALIAARVNPEQMPHAAAVINGHPGIFRSYRMEHEFNLWFTIVVQPGSPLGLERTLEKLTELTGAQEMRPLPALALFKAYCGPPALRPLIEPEPPALTQPRPYDRNDVTLIRVVQGDLPVASDPYRDAAARLGMPQLGMVAYLQSMEDRRLLRRIGATLNAASVGFGAQGIGLWKVPPEMVAEVGDQIAAHPEISHCSQRPADPDWPYSLLCSACARSRDELEASFDQIARDTGISEYVVLHCAAELKDAGPLYFMEEFRNWEHEHAGV